MAPASRPRPAGTDPHAASYQARPSSRLTRPGSRPGARPMSRAPITLPRRRAGRKRALGHASAIAAAASATSAPSSASDGRPITTTTPSPPSPACARRGTCRRPGVVVDRVGVLVARRAQVRGPAAVASPGPVRQHGGGELAERAGAWGELDHRHVPVDGGAAEAEEQDGQFLSQVPRQHHHARGGARLVDRRPGQCRAPPRRAGRRRAGRRRSRSRSPTWRAWPTRRRPRWRAGPPRAPRWPRARARPAPRQALGHRGQSLAPRHRHELVDPIARGGTGPTHERLDQAVLGVDGLEAEPPLVTQPALVQRVTVHAEQAGDPVRRRLDGGAAPEGAHRARRLDLVEVPGPRREPVRARR